MTTATATVKRTCGTVLRKANTIVRTPLFWKCVAVYFALRFAYDYATYDARVHEDGHLEELTREWFPLHGNIVSYPEFARRRSRGELEKYLNPEAFGDELAPSNMDLIPRIIHITALPRHFSTNKVQRNILSFAKLNPHHLIVLYDNPAMRQTLEDSMPSVLPAYDSLPADIQRADTWRYFIMYVVGGVYVDSDVECLKPINNWGNLFKHKMSVVMGIETSVSEWFAWLFLSRDFMISQWTLVSAPKQELFLAVVKSIAEDQAHHSFHESNNGLHDTLARTGPGKWTSTVEKFLLEHKQVARAAYNDFEAHEIDEIGILPPNCFGAFQLHSGVTWNSAHPDVLIRHQFSNSWFRQVSWRPF